MSVPDNDHFNQRDVVTEIYADGSDRSLTELYSAANGIFDPLYVGSKNSLYNFRNYQHMQPNGGYGRLYNGYAINDSRNIAPAGWHVATTPELNALLTTIGGFSVAGGKLKEIGTTHWFSPNTGAVDTYSFAAVGNGFRDASGLFSNVKKVGTLGASYYGSYYRALEIYFNQLYTSTDGVNPYYPNVGVGVRLIKDDSTNPGIMTDNSGYTYKTIQIGSQVWMASNLRGTKYRNGNDIPVVIDNATWAGLNTGACCSYNNNDAWSYADNYVINDVYIEIYVDYFYDGTNWKMYAYAVYAGGVNLVSVNTNVTITFNYSYYDAAAGRSYNVSGANLTIALGQSQSTNTIIGGYFTALTLLSVAPTNSGTYHYTKGGY